MSKTVITLDKQQIMRLEQIVLDQDEKGALRFLAEIREKVRATQTTYCGIDKLRKT